VKPTLLILSPSRVSSTCVQRALASAERAGRELVVVYVLDTTLSDGVQERIQDFGFVGDAPSTRFLDAVREEHRRRGEAELERIAGLATERGIPFVVELVAGEFLRSSLAAAERFAPDEIFVAQQDRPALSRLVIGSDVKRLERDAGCEVNVYRSGDRGASKGPKSGGGRG
jgi:nucleotide-binding universal stress UspA family protein